MRLLKLDRKRGMIEVLPEDKEDLWLLSLLIAPGDVVEGIVSRRIKREDERGSGKVFTFKVKISAEEIEFSGSSLRIKGRIVEGPEDLVGKGKYQTLDVKEGEKIRVFKEKIEDALVDEIRRAEEESRQPPALIVSLSDEEATFGKLERRLRSVGSVRRSGDEESLREFFGRVRKRIGEDDADIVVVGGPKVIVDEFKRFAEEGGIEKKVYFVVSPLTGEKGLKDIVSKRAGSILGEERRKKIEEVLEEFLAHLSKGDGLASLQPERDAEMGNIEVLLVHEEWVKENRKEAHNLMGIVKRSGGRVYLVTEDVEGEKIVKKLGGRIGIRRYKV